MMHLLRFLISFILAIKFDLVTCQVGEIIIGVAASAGALNGISNSISDAVKANNDVTTFSGGYTGFSFTYAEDANNPYYQISFNSNLINQCPITVTPQVPQYLFDQSCNVYLATDGYTAGTDNCISGVSSTGYYFSPTLSGEWCIKLDSNQNAFNLWYTSFGNPGTSTANYGPLKLQFGLECASNSLIFLNTCQSFYLGLQMTILPFSDTSGVCSAGSGNPYACNLLSSSGNSDDPYCATTGPMLNYCLQTYPFVPTFMMLGIVPDDQGSNYGLGIDQAFSIADTCYDYLVNYYESCTEDCVNDICMSNGNTQDLCSQIRSDRNCFPSVTPKECYTSYLNCICGNNVESAQNSTYCAASYKC